VDPIVSETDVFDFEGIMSSSRWTAVVVFGLLAACGDDDPASPDARPADAMSADAAATVDAGATPGLRILFGSGPLTAHDFGAVVVDASSPSLVLTVQNTSEVITGTLVVSSSDSNFTLEGTDCGDVILAPQATCSLRIQFVPGALGAVSGTVQVTDGTSTASLAVQGTGRATSLSITVARDPALTEVGTSRQRVATITNGGTTTVSGFAATIGDSHFAIDGTSCGSALPAAASCTVTVAFTPTTVGPVTALLEVTGQGEAARHELTETGAGRVTVTVEGDGTVTSEPAGIACGATCTALFPGPVTLTATPAGGSELVAWQGGACSGSSDLRCDVVPSATAQAFAATFAVDTTTTVTLRVTGDAPGAIDYRGGWPCPPECVFEVEQGAQIEVSAYSASNVLGWTAGPCPSGQRNCTLTIDGDTELTLDVGRGEREAWTRIIGFRDDVSLVAFAPDGIVTATQRPILLQKRDRAGATAWSRTIAGSQFGATADLAVAASGDIYLLDAVDDANDGQAGFGGLRLRRLEADGDEIWSRTVADARMGSNGVVPMPSRLALTPTGDAVILGEVRVSGQTRMLVQAFDIDGDTLWADATQTNLGRAIAVSSAGVTHVLTTPPTSGVLRRYSLAGAVMSDLPVMVGAGDTLQALAIDGADIIYTSSTDAVYAVSAAGASVFDTNLGTLFDGNPTLAASAAGGVMRAYDPWDVTSRFRLDRLDAEGDIAWTLVDIGVSSTTVYLGDYLWVADIAIASDGAIATTGTWAPARSNQTYVRFYTP
jgi:hypothetical protein